MNTALSTDDFLPLTTLPSSDAHSEEELVEALYASICKEKVAEDQELEDRTAKAAAKKVRARVGCRATPPFCMQKVGTGTTLHLFQN